MKREMSMFKIENGMKSTVVNGVKHYEAEINRQCERMGAKNASVWCVENLMYVYAEFEDDNKNGIKELLKPFMNELSYVAFQLGSEQDMDLMYHCIGNVREDKSLIRRRVFATVLKPCCAAEYKARHQKLIDERGDAVIDGPETNFTIRCAQDKYIIGYCELVKSYDHEPTEDEKAATAAWETRQLEIMDWLTDDVDWLTGEKHEKMANLFLQKGY